MRISVIIPAYNAVVFITTALDSVREQTILPFEIIITNDGSTDETEYVIKQYIKDHPSLPIKLVNQLNKGIGAARNNGLFRATGDFVAFLDADDFWYPKKLETVEHILIGHKDVDVVYHSEMEVDIHGKKKPLRYGKITGEPYRSLLLRGNRLSPSATVVRRSLVFKVEGFSEDPKFHGAEDYDFWLRLAKTGARFFYLNEILGEYRRSQTGITSKPEYHAHNAFNVFKYHLEMMYQDGMLSESEFRKMLRIRTVKRDTRIARSYHLFGEPGKAIQFYIKCIKQWPFYWKTYGGLALSLKDHFLANIFRF